MREVHAADGGQDADADSDTDTDIDSHLVRSHTPSLEDLDAADAHRIDDHFVRLDGEVRVPACTHSSFRSTHMGREVCLLCPPPSPPSPSSSSSLALPAPNRRR
jgi:hypothetical protein